jgi:hypothetical protein
MTPLLVNSIRLGGEQVHFGVLFDHYRLYQEGCHRCHSPHPAALTLSFDRVSFGCQGANSPKTVTATGSRSGTAQPDFFNDNTTPRRRADQGIQARGTG